jgi:hypothetical protein
LLAGSEAHANGRYPLANQLVVNPKDPSHVAVRSTFGLVTSSDRGTNWSWVCERAAGFVDNEDPPIELSGNNTLLVASSQMFTASPDFGCSWSTVSTDDGVVVDADVDRGQPNRVVAVASLYLDGGYAFALRQSLDDGITWTPLGTPSNGYAQTVAVAPSLPHRIYVSSISLTGDRPKISRTDDDGATWQEFPLPNADNPMPFLGAVDPSDPDRVYVRSMTSTGKDVLFVTDDAGASWKQILMASGNLLGFALSPDGKNLAVGGPSDPLSIANVSDYQFKQVSDTKVTCLTWSTDGIYACTDQGRTGFSVGLSTDTGATFTPVFELSMLTLKQCSSSTATGQSCSEPWLGLASKLGIDAGTETADPDVPDGGDQLDASSPVPVSVSSDASRPDASPRASETSGSPDAGAAASGCAISPSSSGRGPLAGILAMLLGLATRATRGRRRV